MFFFRKRDVLAPKTSNQVTQERQWHLDLAFEGLDLKKTEKKSQALQGLAGYENNIWR